MSRPVYPDPNAPRHPAPYGGSPSPYGHGAPQPQPPGPVKASDKAGKRVAILAGGLVATAAIAAGVYFSMFHYAPVALEHVPSGTTVAVRLDLVDLATFAPVRTHLLPLLDEADAGAAKTKKTRTERLGEAAGFSPERDVREMVVCFVGGVDKPVVLVGGRFPQGKLVPGLLKVAQDEGSTAWVSAGDILKSKGGNLFVGQAKDGTAVIATDEQTLRAALPSQQVYKSLNMPTDGAVSFAASSELWKQLSTSSYATMLDTLQKLGSFNTVTGTLSLGSEPKMRSTVTLNAGANVEDAKALLYRVFTDLRRGSELRRTLMGSAQDLAGEEQALSQAKVETRSATELSVTTPWPYEGLDRGARSLANTLRTMGAVASGVNRALPSGNIQLPGGVQLTLPLPGLP